MYRLKQYYNPERIKGIWEDFYSRNTSLSPYQAYSYAKNIHRWYKIKFVRKPVYFLVLKDGEPICIAPLTQERFSGQQQWRIFGIIQGCDICDFIFPSSLSQEDMVEVLRLLLRHLQMPIYFERLLQDSLLVAAARVVCPTLTPIPTVYISLPEIKSVDSWFSSLRKSTRQNLRTAYNRMSRDGIHYSLVARNGEGTDGGLWGDAMGLYFTRQREKYNSKKIPNLLKKHSTITLSTIRLACGGANRSWRFCI